MAGRIPNAGQKRIFLLAVLSQAEDLPKGKIIGHVACSTPGHTYALYLPSAYDPGRTWPVV